MRIRWPTGSERRATNSPISWGGEAPEAARRWTLNLQSSYHDRARKQLEGSNAFMDPNEADRRGVRLRLPL